MRLAWKGITCHTLLKEAKKTPHCLGSSLVERIQMSVLEWKIRTFSL